MYRCPVSALSSLIIEDRKSQNQPRKFGYAPYRNKDRNKDTKTRDTKHKGPNGKLETNTEGSSGTGLRIHRIGVRVTSIACEFSAVWERSIH